MPALAPAADGEGGVVTWEPSCDPARMARWQAIDRERARRSVIAAWTAPEPTEALPVAAAPAEARPARRRWGGPSPTAPSAPSTGC